MSQQDALDILKLGHNVFLTGSAGFRKHLTINSKEIDYEDLQQSSKQTGEELNQMNWIDVQVMQNLFVHELQD